MAETKILCGESTFSASCKTNQTTPRDEFFHEIFEGNCSNDDYKNVAGEVLLPFHLEQL
jgi:hypothetical protein